jgi:tripartite-type tricarboxylate transporter receptor subunit TctC
VSTLGELSELARKRPGELNIAAGNHGSILHLTAEWLRAATGTDLTIVNYPALPQALADLIGGRIQLMVEAVSGLSGAIGAGKVKPLAVASAQRLPDRPDIPATTELLAGFIASGWFALVAPPKTPEAIARFVSADLRKVLAQPEVGERLRELGTYTRPMSPPELAGFIRDQQTIWKPVIEQVRLKSPQ